MVAHYLCIAHREYSACSVVTGMDCAFSVPRVIRGYQRIWTPFIGEKATMAREPGNQHDRYTVAVLEDQTLCTIGHIPHEISKD